MVKLSASYSFKTAEEALENIMAISQNKVTPAMKNFLTTSLPATKSSKKQKFLLGIADPNMGREIFEETGITATTNDSVRELMRGIRTHFVKIMKKIEEEDVRKASLGLGHSFSRTKCATDVNR
jgi:nucleolar protein 56